MKANARGLIQIGSAIDRSLHRNRRSLREPQATADLHRHLVRWTARSGAASLVGSDRENEKFVRSQAVGSLFSLARGRDGFLPLAVQRPPSNRRRQADAEWFEGPRRNRGRSARVRLRAVRRRAYRYSAGSRDASSLEIPRNASFHGSLNCA